LTKIGAGQRPGRRIPGYRANFSGAIAAELKTLSDSNTVPVLDLVGLTKAHDGAVEASELRDADDSEIGETLEPRSAAAVLVWEHTWAAPFAAAVRTSGGALLGNDRIATQALFAAAEADRQPAIKGA
jgi:hypothetical protein